MFNKIKKRVSGVFSKPKKEVKYEFHKWKKQLVVADIAVSFIVVALIFLGVFRLDFLMVWVYLLIYPYLFLTARKNAFYHLYVSSLMALLWVFIANSNYEYNKVALKIFGLNAYSLFAWASGFFAIYMLYSHWEHKVKFVSFIKRLALFTAFYWVLLISVETIAYHVFGLMDMAVVMYSGLPICNCMHGPLWMKVSYFVMGPIYFIICELLGLENPRHVIKKK
jgi:hypothetical protein